MKTFLKLLTILSAVFLLPKLSNAQSIVFAGGSTTNNIVDTRNIAREDSAHEFGQRDTTNHSYRAGTMISWNGKPYWFNGVFWYLLAGDTSSFAQVNADWLATSGAAFILNKPTLATVATSGSYADLSGKPTIPAAQVNSDWNSFAGLSQILNRPRIVDSIYRIVGKDSIYFTIREAATNTIITYAILDSAGAGGGGGGTVDSVFIDNFAPLFNTSVINNGIKPHFTFNPINAPAFSVLGNSASSSGAYSFIVPNATLLNQWFGATIQPAISSSNTQIIYNNAGTLGGNNNLTYNQSTNVECVGCATAGNLATLQIGGSTGSGTVTGDSLKLVATNSIEQFITNSVERMRIDNSGNVSMFNITSGTPNDSVLTINASTGKLGWTSRTVNLFPVQGLKSYGNTLPNDSIGLGGFLYQNDSLNLNFFGLYLQNMVNKASLSGTDSIMGIQADGKTFKIPSTAIAGGGGGTTIYTGDGTLAGNRTVSGGGNSLSFGSTGSKIASLAVNSVGAFQYLGGSYASNGGSQILVLSGNVSNPVTGTSGTVTNYSSIFFGQPTINSTNTGVSYTNPSTVTIQGAPVMGTNSSATNYAYSLFVNSGDAYFGGSGIVNNLRGNSPTPGGAAGTGAGTSPTTSVTGTNLCGTINVTTGTTPTGSNATVYTVTYNGSLTYQNGSIVELFPGNAATAALAGNSQVFATTTGTTFSIISGVTALAASTAYIWYYQVMGNN